jgi:hypothetical protein
MRVQTSAPRQDAVTGPLYPLWAAGRAVSKFRFGWPDLLLILGLALALNGYFYTAMTMLAIYAVLYRRATIRHRREQAAPKRLTRRDIARIYGVPEKVLKDERPKR